MHVDEVAEPQDAPEADVESFDGPDLEAILADEAPLPPADEVELPAEVQAPEPTVVPPAAAPAPVPQPQDDRVSEGLKALMDRERELQAERRKLEEERASLEPLRRYQELHRRLNEDDAEGALQELGVKLDDVNRAVVEGRGVQPGGRAAAQLQSKLEEIQKALDERVKRVEQYEVQRLQQETRAEVSQAIAPDRFPLAASVGDFGVQAVINKAQEHFKRDGQVPSYDQVILEVETELGQFVDQIMKSEAVRARYLSQGKPSDAPRTPSPTLTNGTAAAVAKRKPATNNTIDLSRFDRSEDAIEAILADE